MLLGPGGEQSAHAEDARPCTGEIALGPPLLGASQRLLNRDHFAVYYEVHRTSVAPSRVQRSVSGRSPVNSCSTATIALFTL